MGFVVSPFFDGDEVGPLVRFVGLKVGCLVG